MPHNHIPAQRYQRELEELWDIEPRFRHSRRNRAARSYLGALYIVTTKRRKRKHAHRMTYTVALAVILLFTALGVTWLLLT
jgi:hypothetical protein